MHIRTTSQNFSSSKLKCWRHAPLALLLFGLIPHAGAVTAVWDPGLSGAGSDGSGLWNTTTANWSVAGSDVLWPNTFSDVATFGSGGVAGTVTATSGIQTNGLIFNATSSGNYTIAGGSITFGGVTPTITTNIDATLTATSNGSGITLTKAGAGKLTLNGATTSLPQIDITAGTLATSTTGAGAFGNSTTALNFSANTTLQTSGAITVANPITLNGGTNAAVIGSATLSGPLTLNSGNSTFSTTTAATISGNITGAGSLTKTGAQKLTLSGTNTYLGTTTISNGSIQVGNGGTTGTLGSGAVVNGGVLSFNRSDSFIVPNNISGVGSLTKAGGGTMRLSGANTYTGTTTVSAGILEVTGSIASGTASPLVVASGAMLSGTGTITGPTAGTLTLLGGAQLSPGLLGAIGTLSATSLNWTSDNVTAAMIFNLSNVDTTSDLVSLTGSFVRAANAGSYIFDFENSGVLGNTYTLFDYGSTTSTNTATLAAIDLPSFFTAKFTMTSTRLSVTIVPEPSTALFGLLALGASCRRRRIRLTSASHSVSSL
ncbi:MAG: autotransporter-associated beta strand repeat-containing protein [Chthoniobacteraceae bacterium]